MNESIYNLVPQERSIPTKGPMHKSSHNHSEVKVPGSTFGCKGTTRLFGAGECVKKDGALYGPPKPDLGFPTVKKDKFGASGTGEPFQYTDRRNMPVPSKTDRPIYGLRSSKNFVTANAVEAILQVPKPVGNQDLNYMAKEDFGKVPAYLSQVKDEIRRENDMIDRYVKEQMGEVERPPEVFEEITEDERIQLIADLKAKWENTNAKYQKITHLVLLDTAGQIRRKESLEAELTQLQNDIEKLERASTLLVSGK